MNVLVINCGSSSLKFQLINSDTEAVLAKGLCERIGIDGRLTYQPAGGEKTTEDKAILHSLGDKIIVYRGVSDRKKEKFDYLSWSYSYEQAEWFAKRYNEDSIVYKAEIDKKHIFALTNRRQESEIILDPNYLSNIQVFARFTPEQEESLTK